MDGALRGLFWPKSGLREACSLCVRIHLMDGAERCTGNLARPHFEKRVSREKVRQHGTRLAILAGGFYRK